jgi:cytochrome c553
LRSYKAGETVGAKSGMMWGQAANLSETDIQDLAEYVRIL